MSNRLNRRYSDYAARPRRKKKKSGKKSSGRRGVVTLAVGALALCFAIGFFLTQTSGGDSTKPFSLADIYHEETGQLSPNQQRYQEVLSWAVDEPVSEVWTPIHIFINNGSFWYGSGVLHEPTQVIATSEHVFQESHVFQWRRIWEQAPQNEADAKYLNRALEDSRYRHGDTAFAAPGKKAVIAASSNFNRKVLSSSDYQLLSQPIMVTSLLDGKEYPIIGRMIADQEKHQTTLKVGDVELITFLRAHSNRFLLMGDQPVVVGQSGEGYIAEVNGRSQLYIQGGGFSVEEWNETTIQRVVTSLRVAREDLKNIHILYTCDMRIFE